MSSDLVKRKHDRDVVALTGSKFRRVAQIGVVFLSLLILWIVLSGTGKSGSALLQGVAAARAVLLARPFEWSDQLVATYDSQRAWLSNHGISLERQALDWVATFLFTSAAKIESERGNLSFLSNSFLSLHFAVLRVIFVVLACWRLWVALTLAAWVYTRLKFKPHGGRDLLGETGNGRLFYSGILADLRDVDERGAPIAQVTGLACPQRVEPAKYLASHFHKVLRSFEAENPTNQSLASIILKYEGVPWFVASKDEQNTMENVFAGATLGTASPQLLEAVLTLHGLYRKKELPQNVPAPAPGALLTTPQLLELIVQSLNRVLTPAMRSYFSEISPRMVATLVLTLDAGKCMVHSYEGGRWLLTSNFPQLSARAVLHSIASFADDYSTAERTDLRRALVFGSRKSIFAPVRLPDDLTSRAKVLRQWAEILLASPHHMQTAADEAELFGLVDEIHERWSNKFFDVIKAPKTALMEGALASKFNLLFLPVAAFVGQLRESVSREVIDRIGALNALVSQKHRLHSISGEQNNDEVERGGALTDKQLVPLSVVEIKEICSLHSLDQSVVKDWSALRIILNSFGWLARRVGDYTVPDSSIIFLVGSAESPLPDSNSLGLVGRGAMVPLRATKVAQRWGKSWGRQFGMIGAVSMAEDKDHYDRLMRGEKDRIEEEITAST